MAWLAGAAGAGGAATTAGVASAGSAGITSLASNILNAVGQTAGGVAFPGLLMGGGPGAASVAGSALSAAPQALGAGLGPGALAPTAVGASTGAGALSSAAPSLTSLLGTAVGGNAGAVIKGVGEGQGVLGTAKSVGSNLLDANTGGAFSEAGLAKGAPTGEKFGRFLANIAEQRTRHLNPSNRVADELARAKRIRNIEWNL